MDLHTYCPISNVQAVINAIKYMPYFVAYPPNPPLGLQVQSTSLEANQLDRVR